ncbi:MAG: hypothetical protein WCA27_13590 [Candidatus Sulfotelmatobacter sp.]
MRSNTWIRKLLEQKLDVKRAQLYNLAKQVADSLSISTADAILVLAAKNNINLHKHGPDLSKEKLDEIRRLVPQLPANTNAATVGTIPGGKRNTPKAKKVFQVKLEKAEDDPVLSAATHAEMEAMVKVYEVLYQLENSIRQLITRVLKANHGDNWWDKLAPRGLKDTLAKRTRDEEINAWHQKRSTNPIDYLDLDQLPALVRAAQADFVPAFFRSIEWFQHFIDEVYVSRCVVCHMNPLNQTNVDGVGLAFNKWETLAKRKILNVEKLEEPEKKQQEAVPQAPVAVI